MTENQDFYTDALQAFDVPAAPQKETAVETENLPAPVPEKKKRPRWVKLLCCILCAALLVGGGLAVWLEYRPLPDTDPNAPFQDLSDRTKQKVIKAVSKYWQTRYPTSGDWPAYWYGEENPDPWYPLHGLMYFGTFGGYHIILSGYDATLDMPGWESIGGYGFAYSGPFALLAYKDGTALRVSDVYKDGLLTDAQIGLLHQCYECYGAEIYHWPWMK